MWLWSKGVCVARLCVGGRHHNPFEAECSTLQLSQVGGVLPLQPVSIVCCQHDLLLKSSVSPLMLHTLVVWTACSTHGNPIITVTVTVTITWSPRDTPYNNEHHVILELLEPARLRGYRTTYHHNKRHSKHLETHPT